MRATTLLLGTTLLSTLMLAACQATRDESGQIQSSGTIDAFAMRVGDCFDDSFFTQDEVSDLPGVPCGDPHDNEVYALFDIPGDTWPGEDRVDEMADEGCFQRFEAAIGAPYEESVLYYSSLYPTEDSWNRVDDREVICVAFHMEDEKLTQSVLGSGM